MRFIDLLQMLYRWVLGLFCYTFIMVEHMERTGEPVSLVWLIVGSFLVAAAVMPWYQDGPGGDA